MEKTKILRKIAKNKPCMVRIPGICNGDPETTVLAHYRLTGTCGAGMKPDDEQAAWACSRCHDVCDGRMGLPADSDITGTQIRLYHAEGVFRTQYAMRNHK